jgi:hypothetical protein
MSIKRYVSLQIRAETQNMKLEMSNDNEYPYQITAVDGFSNFDNQYKNLDDVEWEIKFLEGKVRTRPVSNQGLPLS